MHLAPQKSVYTSSITTNQFGESSVEISSHRVHAGRRIYFIDLKQEKDKGELFLKIKEKSNQKKSVILMELSKIPSVIESLKEAFGPHPYSKTPDSYAKISSTTFENKSLEIFARENKEGQYLILKESYDKGVRAGNTTQIMIAIEYLRQFVSTLEIILTEWNDESITKPPCKN